MNMIKVLFDAYILLLTVISCIINLYFVCFPIEPNTSTNTFYWLMESQFYLDFILNFFTTYKDQDTLEIVKERRLIIKNYLKGWCIIDLLTLIPFSDLLEGEGKGNSAKLLRMARLTRLTRMLKLLKLLRLLKLPDML